MPDNPQPPELIGPDEALAVLGALGSLYAAGAMTPAEYEQGCSDLLRLVAHTVMWEAALPVMN